MEYKFIWLLKRCSCEINIIVISGVYMFSDCPSVRFVRFPGIFLGTHEISGLKFVMLMYPDHLQNWLDFGHGLLLCVIVVALWHSKTGHTWSFQILSVHRMGIIVWNLTCWCMLTTFRNDQILVMVCWFSLFLSPLWINKTGHIWCFWAFSWEPIGGMAWNLVCWCILTTTRID